MDFEVRPFGPEDGAVYPALRLEALQRAPEAFASSYAEEAGLNVEDAAARVQGAPVFGIWAAGEAVGMAGLRRLLPRKLNHRGEIWGMYVRDDWRGHGAGDALMRALLAHADGLVRQVELTVVADNDRAVRFYQRYGFVVCGRIPAAAREGDRYIDDLIMVRQAEQAAG